MISRALRLASFAGALALLQACSTPIASPISGFSCCNMRLEDGWVSSNNVQGRGTMVPAGERIQLDQIKRDFYVYGTFGGQHVAFRDDNAKTEAETLSWLRRITVAQDPRPQLEAWPVAVRNAVQSGRVVVGMTRAQVLVSLGHPSRSDTPTLERNVWRYWTALEDEPVDLVFDAQGALSELKGKASAVRTLASAS